MVAIPFVPGQSVSQAIAVSDPQQKEITKQQAQFKAEQQEQKQQETKVTQPLKVVTWSKGGFGHGTSRTVLLDGQPWATIQIPKAFEGREDEYVKSQIPSGYKTPSEVTPEQQTQSRILTEQIAEARHAGFQAHEQEQRDLLSGFQQRVATGEVRATPEAISKVQAAGYDVSQVRPTTQVGIQAAKIAEAKVAQEQRYIAQSLSGTTQSEALAIQSMLKSPTTTFASQEVAQRGFDIVRGKGFDIKPEEVKAQIKVEQPVSTTIFSDTEPLFPQIYNPEDKRTSKFDLKPRQEAFEKFVFSQPFMTDIEGRIAEKEYGRLSRPEKAGLLVTTGFARPEIAGKYFEEKIFGGGKTGYEKDIYQYAMKDSKFVDIPVLGRQAIPKTEVVKDVVVGLGSAVLMGGIFKGISYVGSPIVRGVFGAGGRTLGFAERQLGSLATKSEGVVAKTTLQTGETLTSLGKTSLQFGSRHPEAIIGAGFVVPFVADIAKSETKGEATAKIGYTLATLPLMGVGYKGTERIGEKLPTKAEIISKFREPSAYEMMTPEAQKIYKNLPTTEAKTIMSEATKIAFKARNLPERAFYEMAKETEPTFSFGKTRDIGERGYEVQKIAEQHPEDIIVGSLAGSRFIKGLRSEEVKLPTKNIHITEDMPQKEHMKGSVKAKIGDIELASDFAKRYENLNIEGLDVHGRTKGAHKFGTPGESITTHFMGRTVKLTPGKVMNPITYKDVTYQHPLEQFWRKIEGGTKFMSRNIENLGEEKVMYKEFVESKPGAPGFSIRRGKDVPDIVSTATEMSEKIAKYNPKETKSVLKSAQKIREAEATKLYSGLPVEKYAYEYAKEYPKMVKTPPIFTEKYTKTEYPDVVVKAKSPVSYYPEGTKKVESIVGGYYPTVRVEKPSGGYYLTTKKETTVYPPPTTTEYTGYYPPSYPPVRTPLTKVPPKKTPPIIVREKTNENVFNIPSFKQEEERKTKQKQPEKPYTKKFRASPIFEGAEKLFEDNPIGKPKKSSTKPQVKRTSVKPTSMSKFDVELEGFAKNIIGDRVKSKKNILRV